MKTLLLDRTNWDLCLDTSRNIAVASDPYSQAQDVASAIRLFRGELWYNTAVGVPYFSQILGQPPPLGFMKEQFVARALTVPGVVSATAYLTLTGRDVGGQVQFKTDAGQTLVASTFGASVPPFAITDGGTPGVDDAGQQIVVG